MATEVHTPKPVQAHTIKPDLEIDEQGTTWLFLESNYGRYKVNHTTLTAPPPPVDPISLRMGFDPGHINIDSILYSHVAARVLADKPGPFTGNVL